MPTGTVAAQAAYALPSRTIIIRSTAGLLVGLTGCINMLSAIVPTLNWDMLLGTWPVDTSHGVHKLIVVVGFFLLMLSYGLKRGKFEGWCTAVIFLLLSAVLRLLAGQVLALAATAALLTLLIFFSRSFRARSDPPCVRRGYIALLAGLGIVTLYTIGGFFLLYAQFEPLVDRYGIEDVLLRLLTHAHLHLTQGTQAFVFGRALPVLCLSAVLYGIVQVLHPVAVALLPNKKERQAAALLTHAYGRNSISYFALDADKATFFTASGRSVISYVLEGNVAVVAGDPLGPEEEMLSAIEQFVAFCHEQDWTTVFWQASDAMAGLYRSAGLRFLKIGEDAVIDTRRFTLAGKAMANVRSSAKRAEKEGLRVVFYRGRVQNLEHLIQMERVSQTWLASKGGSEMGFSMGHFDACGDDEQVCALAVDQANTVHAFVTFVPIYGRGGWGLDLMRRAGEAVPGTMELLLARSIHYLKDAGAEMVSLGLAPMSNVNADTVTLLDSSIDFLTHRFGNLSQSQSLFAFKKKFQPNWESRYLVYSSTLTLPKVGWALYHAHQRDVSLLALLYRSLRGGCQGGRQASCRSLVDLGGGVPRHSTSGGLVS